ncbi:MAG: TonB-dependent receptor [Pseudomonadota bacterium]
MNSKLRLAALLTSVSLPVTAFAQDTGETTVLDPIIVTAEKRASEAHDVPASLSVEEGADLTRRKTTRREQAIAETPNAVTGPVTATLYTSFTAIRGVGSALIESDPAVGLNIDGIGIGSTQAYNGSLLDVDRIEVLRGPQGTLYGRNTIAGTVNVISNLPDPDELGAELSFDYGSYGTVNSTGIVNLPFGDSGWAARGALSFARTSGSMTSSATGEDLGDGRDLHGRISLSGNVTDNLEFLGIVDVEQQRLDSEMFGMPESDFIAGKTTAAIDDPSKIESDLALASGQFTYHLGNGDKIVSQTGYLTSSVKLSGNGFPEGYFAAFDALFQSYGFSDFRYRSDNPYDGDYQQWSQEVRYVSEGNGRFDWVAGLYGEYSKATREYGANSSFTGGEVTLGSRGETETTSISTFADGTYALTDLWKVFGGVRIGYDRKSFDYEFNANSYATLLGFSSAFAPGYTDSLSEGYVTPRAGVQFDVTDDINVYASVSTGYKSGGFNAGFVGVGDEGSYESEKLISYEIGTKAQGIGGFFDIDTSVFYIDWRDQQVQGFNVLTGTTPLVNAPRSQSWGGEIAGRLHVSDQWSFRFAAGYADATYKDFENAPALDGSGTVDVSGNQQQFVSRFTGSLGLDYEWDTGWHDLTAKAGVHYQYRSSYYFDVQNTTRQPGYGLLNAYASLGNERYSAYAYGRNLTDTRYRTTAGNLGNGTLVNVGEPLTVGGGFKIKF